MEFLKRDIITKLLSNTNFRKISQKILNNKEERKKGLVFIHFNVENFSNFNSLFGFDECCKLLSNIGKIIKKVFPEFCASRVSDDNFFVLAYNSNLENRINKVSENVRALNPTRKILLKSKIHILPENDDAFLLPAQEFAETAFNPEVFAEYIFSDGNKVFYELCNRVDLIKYDDTEISNIYLSSSHYSTNVVKNSVKLSVENFAEKNIYFEDRKSFKQFLELETLEKRIKKSGDKYIMDYFRTKDEYGKFVWQVYFVIPLSYNDEKYFLFCSRNIDTKKLKHLPEINRQGTEYFEMPGNPIFLMLASRSFSSILGYGSFEKFLYNSFYLEVNLTTRKILYLHFGNFNMIRMNLGEYSTDYCQVIDNFISNTVVDEYQKDIAEFFDCERLLKDFDEGEFFSEIEFLSQSDNENNHWLHMVCQIRESAENDEVHAFFLIFDIDVYHRKNEAILNLLERDTLTDLYNRRTAFDLIDKILDKKESFAFIILDLDNFKQINDKFGHDCGDKIIKDVSLRMKEHFYDAGIVARLGGDEFLVIQKNLSPSEIEIRLKNFSDTAKSIQYKNVSVNYTMSIGYSIYPEQGKNYRELYQNADMALYSVKMSGRNSYKKFSPKMITDNRSQLGVSLSQISEGMPGGFLVYYNNENLEIIYANTRLWKIYDCNSLEEFRKFTGNSFRGCVHPDDFEKVQETIDKQVAVSNGYDYVRYRIKTANDKLKVIEDFGRLVSSKDGDDVFYVFMIDFVAKEKLWDFVTKKHILPQ